jgi:prephenate dehydrogenase
MPISVRFERVFVLGLGVIGGSFCKALNESGMAKMLVGFALPEDANLALQAGAVDLAITSENDLPREVMSADLVVLALPVTVSLSLLPLICKHLGPNAVLTDTCSVKVAVAETARNALGLRSHQYVGGHPIAGSHLSGFEGAQSSLFKEALVILEGNSANLVASTEGERIAQLWRGLGAQVKWMSALAHDELYAHVSHLPHLAAFALMNTISAYAKANNVGDLSALVGKGFLDTTRIAASSASLWADISQENRQPLMTSLDGLIFQLNSLREMLAEGDGLRLHAALLAASEARNKF